MRYRVDLERIGFLTSISDTFKHAAGLDICHAGCALANIPRAVSAPSRVPVQERGHMISDLTPLKFFNSRPVTIPSGLAEKMLFRHTTHGLIIIKSGVVQVFHSNSKSDLVGTQSEVAAQVEVQVHTWA